VKKATLALAGGEVFEGTAVAAEGESVGEVVFNTSHTGYQEILTDPSYAGQIVTFTVSEVGNYGIHLGDEQAATAQVAGLIARRVCKEPSNWRSQLSLPAFLSQNGLTGIEGVDTRKLVRILRDTGAQMGIVDTTGASPQALVERARKAPGMEGQDLATKVSCKTPSTWAAASPWFPRAPRPPTSSRASPTGSCSPTAPAIPRRSLAPTRRRATCSARFP
jgi:carbamoyl-phosphate synthase small subunit